MPTQSSLFDTVLGPVRVVSKAKRKRSKARVFDGVAKPWPCVVLAVDTATRSGWAIRDHGKLVWSGEVDTLDAGELLAVVKLAGSRKSVPCVLVLERPFFGGRNPLTIGMSLGGARERWLLAWEHCGERRDKRVVSVTPAVWRSRVLGRGTGSLPREKVRPIEMRAARLMCGGDYEPGEDEAPAICISKWAAHAPEIGAALTGRRRK